jgi:hypothetical protein
VKDEPHFADALRRRLEPAWLAAEKSWRLAGLCDAALDMTVDRVRVVQAKKKLLLLGFLLLLRGLCLLRFLRHVALQAMSEWRYRYDERLNAEHRTPITTATRKEIRIELVQRRQGPRMRMALLEVRRANALRPCFGLAEYSSSPHESCVIAETRINQGFLRHKIFFTMTPSCILDAIFFARDKRA